MAQKLDLDASIKYWHETGDPMLQSLAESIKELGVLPEEQELIDLLTFYLVFSIGCRELKLDREAEIFSKRADWFLGGLRAAGVKEGAYYSYVNARDLRGLYSRIQNYAATDAGYRMTELRGREKEVKRKKV